METYAINDVERLTGIKAHTLRIWEKRFNGLIAHRTDTKIRYYDDAQLRKVLNISTLLQHGYKISTIMNLPDAEVHQIISSLYDSPATEPVYDIFINTLVAAMLDFDERTLDKSFSNMFVRFGVYGTMINIVYPFLRKTGVLWTIDSAIPAQEHFASNIIRRKLLSAIDGIPYPADSKKKFILCLPPDELHEIGLLFSDYVVRSAGYETVYLGVNTPFGSLQPTISKSKADYLLTFYPGGKDHASFQEHFAELAKNNPKTKIIICTNIVYYDSNTLPNIIYLNEPNKLFDIL